MRGRVVAACAAVLVGLASPGAFASASLANAFGCVAHDSVSRASPRGTAAAPPAIGCSAGAGPAQLRGGESRSRGTRAAARSIWRSPSGPAPSQAPPA